MIEIKRPLPQTVLTSLRRHSKRTRRAPQWHRKLRRAANLHEFVAITLKLRVLCEGGADFAKNSCSMFVGGIDQSIMHPFPFPTRADNAGSSQICQMTRNLRLTRL